MTCGLAMVLAHGSGWDEVLFPLIPISVLGGLLWLAKRRAERADDGQGSDPEETK